MFESIGTGESSTHTYELLIHGGKTVVNSRKVV
jgi:hypothetical protein